MLVKDLRFMLQDVPDNAILVVWDISETFIAPKTKVMAVMPMLVIPLPELNKYTISVTPCDEQQPALVFVLKVS